MYNSGPPHWWAAAAFKDEEEAKVNARGRLALRV